MNRLANTLKLADETELEGSCGLSGNSLWCWISNMSMADCFTLFNNNPEKTREITIYYITKGIKYSGFTVMELIKTGTDAFGNSTIDVKLTWPEGAPHSVEEFPIEPDAEGGEE